MDYSNDQEWSEWNRAAKLRILMRPTPPLAQYFIEAPATGSVATRVSSLAHSTGLDSSKEVVDRATDEAKMNRLRRVPPVSTYAQRATLSTDGLGVSTTPGVAVGALATNNTTPVSETDSEKTEKFRTLEGWNKENHLTFESEEWDPYPGSDYVNDEREEEARLNGEVRQYYERLR